MSLSDDFKADITQAILWQFENSPNLIRLIKNKQAFYDNAVPALIEKLERDFFNIETANLWGLVLWSLILNIPIAKQIAPQTEKKAFGFGVERRNFRARTNFGNRAGGIYSLTTEQARRLIRTRIFTLTHAPTQDNINRHLSDYYSQVDSKVYVIDQMDMQWILYNFNYEIDSYTRFLIEEFDLLPRPSTLGTRVREIKKVSFGLGAKRRNFAAPTNFGVIGYE